MNPKRYLPWLMLIVPALLIKIFSFFPEAVEKYYSTGIYPLIARWRHRLPGGTAACRRQGPLTQASRPGGDAFVHTPRRT